MQSSDLVLIFSYKQTLFINQDHYFWRLLLHRFVFSPSRHKVSLATNLPVAANKQKDRTATNLMSHSITPNQQQQYRLALGDTYLNTHLSLSICWLWQWLSFLLRWLAWQTDNNICNGPQVLINTTSSISCRHVDNNGKIWRLANSNY